MAPSTGMGYPHEGPSVACVDMVGRTDTAGVVDGHEYKTCRVKLIPSGLVNPAGFSQPARTYLERPVLVNLLLLLYYSRA